VGARSVRLGCAAEQKSGGCLQGTLWGKNAPAHEFRWGERLARFCDAQGKKTGDVSGAQVVAH
jgi:hypothetical protein